jgi:hypothetical protein
MPEAFAVMSDCSVAESVAQIVGPVLTKLDQVSEQQMELKQHEIAVESELARFKSVLDRLVSVITPQDDAQQIPQIPRLQIQIPPRESNTSAFADAPNSPLSSSCSSLASQLTEASDSRNLKTGMRKASSSAKFSRKTKAASMAGDTSVWPASVPFRQEFRYLAAVDAELNRGNDDVFEFDVGTQLSLTIEHRANMADRARKVKVNICRSTIDPNCNEMLIVDMVGGVILMYDLVVSPYLLAWDVSFHTTLAVCAWIVAVYWMLDLCLNFRLGYFRNGQLIMNHRSIVVHYAKTWLVPDCLMLACDWILLLVASSNYATTAEGMAFRRASRFLRFAKLFRIIRLVRLVDKVSLLSFQWSFIILLGKIIFGLLLLNHVLSCLWFIIGKFGSDTGKTWFDNTPYPFDDDFNFSEMSNLYQYVVTLQWITASMTLASCYVEPANSFEGLVSIMLLFGGLLVGGSVVALFSSQIVQIVMNKQEQTRKLATMHQYLLQQQVPRKLSYQVQKLVYERINAVQPIEERDVDGLAMVSMSLREALWKATRSPYLISHPLFRVIEVVDSEAFQAIVEAVHFQMLAANDIVFQAKGDAEEAYSVARGQLRYTQEPESSMVATRTTKEVFAGTWVCEAALWSSWMHVGTLEAITMSQLLVLRESNCLALMQDYYDARKLVTDYGTRYYKRIAAAVPPHAEFPDDIQVPFTDVSDLLADHVGIAFFHHAVATGAINLTDEEHDELDAELYAGRSTVNKTSAGDFERVVAVIALRIANVDSAIFVQVGKWDERRGIKAACLLPSTKRRLGELPRSALEDFVNDELRPLANHLHLTGVGHQVLHKEAKFGMTSTLLRTEHHAIVHGDPELPTVKFEEGVEKLRSNSKDRALLAPRTIFMLPDGDNADKAALYAWITNEEYEMISVQANLKMLEPWFSQIVQLDRNVVQSTLHALKQRFSESDKPFGRPMEQDIQVSNNLRENVGADADGEFEPVFKAPLWKLKANSGDRMDHDHWWLREMWIARNGSLVYFSKKDNKNLVYLTAQDIADATIRLLDADESPKPWSFSVQLAAPDETEDAPPPADFAAETADLRKKWVQQLQYTKRSSTHTRPSKFGSKYGDAANGTAPVEFQIAARRRSERTGWQKKDEIPAARTGRRSSV